MHAGFSKQDRLMARTDKILADEVAQLVEHVGRRVGRGLRLRCGFHEVSCICFYFVYMMTGIIAFVKTKDIVVYLNDIEGRLGGGALVSGIGILCSTQ